MMENDFEDDFEDEIPVLAIRPIKKFVKSPEAIEDLPETVNETTAEKSGLNSNALSFYKSKIILDRPNCLGLVKIVLVGFKSFCLGSN